MHRGAAHAGAGAVGGRPRQKAPRHRARRGGPGPRRPAAPRLHRRPPKPALGGRLHLRADLVGVLLHRLRHGPVLPPDRRLGHQQPHGHRLRARRPGAGDLAAQAPRRRRPRGPGPPQRPRISVPVHRLHRTDSSKRGSRPPPEPWVPPTTTPPPRPSTSPTSASSSGATAPGRDAPTSKPRPPDGWTGTTAPAPTSPTTTTSHPQPSNTATITTTPPPHPPPYNQPSTKPGTIQARVVGLCERGWGRRGLG